MSIKFRQGCSITHAIDVLGDRWVLVIIKQMLFEHAETFKDFLECPEAIATNILSNKLKLLREQEIIRKFRDVNNKKTNYYYLTDKGLALAPVVVEMGIWSHDYLQEFNISITNEEALKAIQFDKEAYCNSVIDTYRQKLTAAINTRTEVFK